MPTTTISNLSSGGVADYGDIYNVIAGGTAAAFTINSGGTLNASSGGVISGATYNYGGRGTISSGATMISTQAVQSDTGAGVAAYIIVNSGATAEYTTVNYYNDVQFSNGAVDISATISGQTPEGRAQEQNGAGATAIGDTVEAYGELFNGGIASNTVVSGVSATISTTSSGTAISTTIGNGGTQDVLIDGTAISTMIGSGGLENVSGSAIDSGAVISGGVQNVGEYDVFGGGTSYKAVVESGGTQNVAGGAGGESISATASNGGLIYVSNGASAVDAKATAGGTVDVESTGVLVTPFIAGGVVSVGNGATVSGPLDFTGTGGTLEIASVTDGGDALNSQVISGFLSAGDTIVLESLPYNASYNMVQNSADVAVLGSGAYDYIIPMAGVPNGDNYQLADVGGKLAIVGWCFLAGTRIATPEAEVAVEDLHEGDLVLTASGEAKPVSWIGYRHVVAAELLDAHLYAPVVIHKDAIAQGKPARDLWVTPDHAILVEGKLIPAKLLVNGTTIRQVPRAEYSYFHIELDQHDLLLAEGLEAESYLDIEASRQRFANHAVTGMALDLSITGVAEAAYAAHGVMPLSLREDTVKPVWEAIAARAEALAPQAASTSDPALHLLVNGRAVQPAKVEGARYLFPVSGSAASIVIASRHTSPWASKPWIDDRRELGVAVASVTVLSDTGLAEVALTGEAAVAGWYAPERDEAGQTWRWTNGAGVLALPSGTGARWVEVTLQGTLDYPAADNDVLWMAEAV